MRSSRCGGAGERVRSQAAPGRGRFRAVERRRKPEDPSPLRPYFSLLARFRCGRIEVEAPTWHPAGSLKGAGGPYSPECVEGAFSELRLLGGSLKFAQIGLIASSKKRWPRAAMYPSV